MLLPASSLRFASLRSQLLQVLVREHFTYKKHTQDASEVSCNLTLWGGSAPPTPRWGSAPDPDYIRRIVNASYVWCCNLT